MVTTEVSVGTGYSVPDDACLSALMDLQTAKVIAALMDDPVVVECGRLYDRIQGHPQGQALLDAHKGDAPLVIPADATGEQALRVWQQRELAWREVLRGILRELED